MLNGHDLDPASLLPPFEALLPATLRLYREDALLKYHGLNRETYSTEHFLSGSHKPIAGASRPIRLERGCILIDGGKSPQLVRYAVNHGLTLAEDADVSRAASIIERALTEVIAPYTFLQAALSELVWCCHVVLAHEDYDVSFSDPAIPFSIFVSTPTGKDHSAILRVAESLIHETMHLQLTLFEELVPLVRSAAACSMYSPWKRQERPVQGIVHGLYVFCILRWMWMQIAQTSGSATDRDFALRRVKVIDKEVKSVRSVEESSALTEAGRRLLGELFIG